MSASGGPRQRSSASRSVAAAVSGAPASSWLASLEEALEFLEVELSRRELEEVARRARHDRNIRHAGLGQAPSEA